MKKINTIDDLAAHMFEVYYMAEPLGNPEFCASLVSCAVTIAARDGLSDEQVLRMVVESATSALAVVRARQVLEGRNSAEVH